MRRLVAIPLALIALSGCEKKTQAPPPLSQVERVELEECLEALRPLHSAGVVRPVEVAAACPSACPDFHRASPAMRLATVTERCRFVCPKATEIGHSTRTSQRLGKLYRVCGEKHYGLPKSANWLLSPDWHAVHQVARWLGTRRQRATEQATIDAIDGARKGLVISLPIPSESSQAELPRSVASQAAEHDLFLLVRSKSIELGKWPRAELDSDGAGLLDTGDGTFPGGEVAIESLSIRVATLRGEEPKTPATALAGSDVTEDSRFGGSSARIEPGSRPLLALSDRRASGARLLAAARALEATGVVLAVRDKGLDARAHAVQLVGTGGPELAIELDDTGIAVYRRGGDTAILGRDQGDQDWRGLEVVLDAMRAGEGVSIAARAVSVQEVVAAMDLLALRGVQVVRAAQWRGP